MGVQLTPMTPEGFGALIARDIDRMREAVRLARAEQYLAIAAVAIEQDTAARIGDRPALGQHRHGGVVAMQPGSGEGLGQRLKDEGVKPTEFDRRLKIARSSVYRVLEATGVIAVTDSRPVRRR